MSNHKELVGFNTDPEWIIFREKSVRKLSFCIRCYNENNYFLNADMDSDPTDVVTNAWENENTHSGYYTVVETTIDGNKTYSFIDGYNDNCDNLKFYLWKQDDKSVKIIRWLEDSGDDNLWICNYMELDYREKLTIELNEAQQKVVDNIIRWEDVFDSLKNKDEYDESEIFSYQKKCYVNLNNNEDK